MSLCAWPATAYLPLCFYCCLLMSVCVCVSLSLSASLSFSVCLSLCLSVCLFLFLSFSLSLSLSLSLSVSFFPSLSFPSLLQFFSVSVFCLLTMLGVSEVIIFSNHRVLHLCCCYLKETQNYYHSAITALHLVIIVMWRRGKTVVVK